MATRHDSTGSGPDSDKAGSGIISSVTNWFTRGNSQQDEYKAEIYKADFLEERKDRERAQGLLIDLQQKKKGVMQEEMKHLQTEIEDLKEERKIQKMEWAQVSGKLEQDLETCKVVIEKLKKEVENISSERDDFKYEAQRMKESKNRKLKEYDKLKVQVKTATALSVHLEGELEKARKDVKELLKFKKKAENKTESKTKKGSSYGISNPQSESEKRLIRAEQLYEEERDSNQSLQIENKLLKGEAEYQKSISSKFKKLLQKELIDDTPLSPEEDEKSLKSLTTDAASTDKDPFENDPNYVASEDPELPLKKHLDKQFRGAKGTPSGDAGVGAYSQDPIINRNGLLVPPKKQLKDHDAGSEAIKYRAEISELRQQLSEQCEIIKKLRQRNEYLEITATDKESYQELLAEVEDERDKLREDFMSAREEMEHLRRENEALSQELRVTKQEAFRLSMLMEVQAATGEQSSAHECKCKEFRTRIGDLNKIMEEKTAQLDVAKHTVENLQTELKEAAGDIAAARAEAEIYKADFMEEHKDRERAEGLLTDLQQKKKDVMQEEMKRLRTEIKDLKEERNAQKMELARVSGKLKQDLETSKVVIDKMKKTIEKVSSDRDDLKYEVERRKESKHRKLKEYDRLKVQVKSSTALSVHLVGELEKARKDNKELLKFKKKAESKTETKPKKAEKAGAKGSNCGNSNSQSRDEEERDRNETLQIEVELLKDEVEHQKSISSRFMILVQKELIDDTPLSPEEDEKSLKSLTTDAASTDKDPFENDLPSEDPELPLPIINQIPQSGHVVPPRKQLMDHGPPQDTDQRYQQQPTGHGTSSDQCNQLQFCSSTDHPQVPSSVNCPPGQEYHEGTVPYPQQSQQQFNQQHGQPNAMLGAGDPQGNDQQGYPRTEEAAQHLQHDHQQALQAMREHLERIKRETQDMEEERSVWEQKVEAEKENNCELETQVTRLTAANEYLKRKINLSDPHSITQDPILQLQVEVRDLQSNITRKEDKIKNLTSSRIILERRLQRMKEERDRLVQYNMELLLMYEQLAVKIAEAEELKKEKEVLLHEIEDLNEEIEARKEEVSLTTEEYENECKDKERIVAVLREKQREWDILEQKLNTEIYDLKDLVEHERLSAIEQQKLESQKWQQEVMFLESKIERLQERIWQSQEQPKFDFSSITRSQVTKQSKIAPGAYGIVHKGKYRGYQVAIKEPHPLILDESTIDSLRREVGCMATVHHPNLVTFIGAVFDDQPIPMIILELMDMNLRSKYNEVSLSKSQTLKIFQDIAYALHYLHEFREPIIHRDLSAPNVLLKSLPHGQYIAKVSDFGSANLVKLSKTSAPGAIIYSAPEMFPSSVATVQRKKQTVKIDTFSYGILLCEVIIRKQPDLDKRPEMLREAEWKWRDMHKLIMNCIEEEPTERPAMSQILTTLREIGI